MEEGLLDSPSPPAHEFSILSALRAPAYLSFLNICSEETKDCTRGPRRPASRHSEGQG